MQRIVVFFVVLNLFFAGCQEREAEVPREALVEANPAYVRHYGPPPQVKEGRAFAMVSYLPLAKDPRQLKALPLYVFNEDDRLQQVVERLLSGELILPVQKDMFAEQFFSGQVTLERIVQQTDRADIFLRRVQQHLPGDLSPLARALTETACQLPAVSRVHLWLNDQPFPGQPAAGFSSQPETVVSVGDPQLLLAAGVWEPEATEPHELMISFDRPISVNSFRVLDEAGEQIGGKYFLSMFNMAVVIHPEQPEAFSAGTPLNVVWDVTDQLGRRNSGIDKLKLLRLKH